VPVLVLYDQDTVAVENLAAQGYRPDQLGQDKAEATAVDRQRINPRTHTVAKAERFRRSSGGQITVGNCSLVVLCCVDSITMHKLIWGAVRAEAALFLDGRMSAPVIRVLAVEQPATPSTQQRCSLRTRPLRGFAPAVPRSTPLRSRPACWLGNWHAGCVTSLSTVT